MTDATAEFEAHDEFEARGDGAFAVANATFDATVEAGGGRCELTYAAPTLPAAVEGDVSDVVADGWFETFERRVTEVGGVTRTDAVETPTVERTGDDKVTVDVAFEARGGAAAEDVRALVTFVEGTWFEGVVPGYDYVDEVQAVREAAHRQGGGGDATPL